MILVLFKGLVIFIAGRGLRSVRGGGYKNCSLHFSFPSFCVGLGGVGGEERGALLYLFIILRERGFMRSNFKIFYNHGEGVNVMFRQYTLCTL